MRLNTYQIQECIPLSLTIVPAALCVCGQGLGMSSVPNEGGTLSPCRDVRRYAPCGMGYVGRGTGMVVVVKRELL